MSGPSPAAGPTLHERVHALLCERENLLPDLFRTVAAPVKRRGKPVGTQFTLLGPRAVRLTAVHDATRGTLFVFDATGKRVDKRAVG